MYSCTHFLASLLDGGEWSASRPSRFTTRERAPGTHWIGDWMSPRVVLDAVVRRKIPSPRRESNPRTPRPVRNQSYTDWAITVLERIVKKNKIKTKQGINRTLPHLIFMTFYYGTGAGIAQWYSAGLRAAWRGSRQGLGIFLFITGYGAALGPTQPPIQWVPGALSLGVNRSGREADHSARGAIPPLPNMPSWPWCSAKKHRDTFTMVQVKVKLSPY
jgi:hypothetical protein